MAAFSLGAPFLVGGVREIAGTNNPESRYTGLIDELQVYNRALTDSEINFLYQNPGQVIPEPGVFALLLSGGLLLGRARRRG